jgi:hypothetical protein
MILHDFALFFGGFFYDFSLILVVFGVIFSCFSYFFFPPQLIRDPQTFAEKLFARVKRSAGSFDARVMALTLISRLIGIHRLIVLNFYPYLLRFVVFEGGWLIKCAWCGECA